MALSALRLEAFIPGLLVPPETTPSISAAFTLLAVSLFSLTYDSPKATLFRLSIAPLALYYFWDYGYGPYATPGAEVDVGLAVIGLYGIMRVLESTFVGLFDEQPPYWVVEGKPAGMPQTFLQRLAYAFDLAYSVRGNSFFAKTHWNWAPRALLDSSRKRMGRAGFLRSSMWSLLKQYVILDIIDTMNKSRWWDRSSPYPVTSLPWYSQLAYAMSVCAGTALSITVPYTMISATFVLLGSHPSSWPPMFDAPFSATSLADFWTRRWHAIFRRVFERLSSVVLRALRLPPAAARAARAFVIFGLSAAMHIMLMYRVDMRETKHPRTFLDPSILKFFLSQPLGLAIEALLIIPLSNVVPSAWKTTLTRAFAWAWLLYSGRFWADVWVHRGFWEPHEKVVGWSVVRGVLRGQWAV